MAGSYQVMEKLTRLTNITREHHGKGMHNPVAVSPDGEYSIEFVECLASCGTAPVVMIDDELHEKVDVAKAKQLADQIKSEAAQRGSAASKSNKL